MKKFFVALGKGLLYVLLYFGAQVIVSIVAALIISFQIGYENARAGIEYDAMKVAETMTQRLLGKTVIITLVASIIILLVLIIEFLIRKKSFFKEIKFEKMNPAYIIPIIFLGIGMNFLTSSLMEVLPIPEKLMEQYMEQSSVLNSGNMAFNFVLIVFVAPLVEEVVFRGLVFTRFQKGMPIVLSATLSALIFGLAHGQIIWMTYAFILGLVLSLVFVKTKSLVGNILLHFTFNLTSGIMMLMEIEETSENTNLIFLIASIGVTILSLVAILYLTKKSNQIIEEKLS